MQVYKKKLGKKVSLVLSGGGSRGAFHLGVLQALDEQKISVEAISGSSIGAIIGAAYLSGSSPIKIFDFFARGLFKKTFKINIHRGTLYKINFEDEIFETLLNGKRKIEELNKSLHVSVTNLEKGICQYKNSGDLRALVCASGSIYPVFTPVLYEGDRLVDGGVIDNFPISPLLNTDLPILGVNLHPNVYQPKQLSLIRVGFLAWHVAGMEEKIRACDYYMTNDLLCKHNPLKTKNIDKLFNLGYEETKKLFM